MSSTSQILELIWVSPVLCINVFIQEILNAYKSDKVLTFMELDIRFGVFVKSDKIANIYWTINPVWF